MILKKKIKIMNQFKNAMYDIQSLEKDFYLGVLGSFNCVFIH
jgi:hypothetical protein